MINFNPRVCAKCPNNKGVGTVCVCTLPYMFGTSGEEPVEYKGIETNAGYPVITYETSPHSVSQSTHTYRV